MVLVVFIARGLRRIVAIQDAPHRATRAAEYLANSARLRAIVDFISEREAASADQCDTLLEVNKRLRSLPPKG